MYIQRNVSRESGESMAVFKLRLEFALKIMSDIENSRYNQIGVVTDVTADFKTIDLLRAELV